EIPLRHDSQALKRDAKLEQIRQNAKSLPLQLRAKRITEIGPVDNPARRQRLRHHRLIADDSELNVVPLRIESPVIERQHTEHPHAAANALATDLFPLETRGFFNMGADKNPPAQLINHPCKKDQTDPPRHSADRGARRRATVELGFSGSEGRQSHRAAAHVDDLSVQTM